MMMMMMMMMMMIKKVTIWILWEHLWKKLKGGKDIHSSPQARLDTDKNSSTVVTKNAWSSQQFYFGGSPVGWGCRVRWLRLRWGLRSSSNVFPEDDMKQSDGELIELELWRMWRTISLQLLPGRHWRRVKVHHRLLSTTQIELFCILIVSKQMTNDKLNC